MDSSQVRCSSCCQYFNNNDIVYGSSKCGHAYHQKCLFDKFNSDSRLCGGSQQCPAICYPRHCRRIYLTFNSFSWIYIEPKIFQANERVFEKIVLKLGANKSGHNIYAARVFLQDKAIPCYYNAEKKRAYQDFECSSDYFSRRLELLDISNDAGHQYTWVDCAKVPDSGYFKENKALIRQPRKTEMKEMDG